MIDPRLVHQTIARHQLVDGLELVFDLDRSRGVWVHDARDGDTWLDAFTCFASWPVGYNHPMLHDADFETELLRCARTKLSNSDLYTPEMASFVDAFCTHVTPPGFPHHFWISGGALAVENALKTAFDWKARTLGRTLADGADDLVILHFRHAFHGRSGYTLSLTNTLLDKIALFPKFHWPRVYSPAIEWDLDGRIANDVAAEERRACAEIEAFLAGEFQGRVAAIIIEPMQGEGGDRHFRPEFLARLRRYADEAEALLIFDEVQTGFFASGKAWLWQHSGVRPDVVAFGKKTQACGIYASERVDEVAENVFRRPSRINSTWGADLTDMVRCRRFIEIIRAERLDVNAARVGERTVAGLREIARESGTISNVRGVGSLVAFSLESGEARTAMLRALAARRVLALPSGTESVRFRLSLAMSAREADELLDRTASAAGAIARGAAPSSVA